MAAAAGPPGPAAAVPDVLIIGTGEYTTGYGKNSGQTDKSAGGKYDSLPERSVSERLSMCFLSGGYYLVRLEEKGPGPKHLFMWSKWNEIPKYPLAHEAGNR